MSEDRQPYAAHDVKITGIELSDGQVHIRFATGERCAAAVVGADIMTGEVVNAEEFGRAIRQYAERMGIPFAVVNGEGRGANVQQAAMERTMHPVSMGGFSGKEFLVQVDDVFLALMKLQADLAASAARAMRPHAERCMMTPPAPTPLPAGYYHRRSGKSRWKHNRRTRGHR